MSNETSNLNFTRDERIFIQGSISPNLYQPEDLELVSYGNCPWCMSVGPVDMWCARCYDKDFKSDFHFGELHRGKKRTWSDADNESEEEEEEDSKVPAIAAAAARPKLIAKPPTLRKKKNGGVHQDIWKKPFPCFVVYWYDDPRALSEVHYAALRPNKQSDNCFCKFKYYV